MTVAQNIDRIRKQIGSAVLVTAAKSQPAGLIREAVAAGVDAVGENRVQELLEKDAQGAYEGVPLHFIGRLQKNKVNKIAGRVALIHSVDSPALAEAIDVCAGKAGAVQDVLVQVNIAHEESKGGFAPDGLFGALKEMNALRNINIRGLMCIPPPGEAFWFERMRLLYDKSGLEILSMGMSDDYEEAVRAGSNMVRIGSALFGARI